MFTVFICRLYCLKQSATTCRMLTLQIIHQLHSFEDSKNDNRIIYLQTAHGFFFSKTFDDSWWKHHSSGDCIQDGFFFSRLHYLLLNFGVWYALSFHQVLFIIARIYKMTWMKCFTIQAIWTVSSIHSSTAFSSLQLDGLIPNANMCRNIWSNFLRP